MRRYTLYREAAWPAATVYKADHGWYLDRERDFPVGYHLFFAKLTSGRKAGRMKGEID